VEKDLAGHFKVQGLPTIKLFPSEMTVVSGGKGMEKKAVDYSGAREAAAIANFALSKLPNLVTKVTKTIFDHIRNKISFLSRIHHKMGKN